MDYGWRSFLGMEMVQLWPDLFLWENFFNRHKLGTFVELGTGHAGMTLFLMLQCRQRGVQFHTFDNVKSFDAGTPLPALLGMEQVFHHVDIFNEGQELIRNLLEEGTRPLALFCDDGDKPREWRTFGTFTHPGDYLIVHDWGTEFKQEDIPPLKVERILTEFNWKATPGWKSAFFRRIP